MSDLAWIALSLVSGIGGVTFRELLRHFETADNVLMASTYDLIQVKRIGKKIASSIQAIDLHNLERRLTYWKRSGVQYLTWRDPQYPQQLIDCEDAPPTLFIKGTLPPFYHPHTAIVGTRQPSPQGQDATGRVAETLARQGHTIISGLALGIDTIALQRALAYHPVIAVLGNGILTPYPSQNRELAKCILDQGALVCEVAPDAQVSTTGLVARNRIIAALSHTTLIAETEADGGAMYAARAAVQYGRVLKTFPFNHASGNVSLLANGVASPYPLPA